MYLAQTINVNLTQENADLLKQPSKVFNKIKSVLSGTMTPTEQRQATVMLSVLQRLNVAMRRASFTYLVSVAVNDQLLYDNVDAIENNLEQGNAALSEGFKSGDIKQINTLSLTVDGERNNLRYVIHVNIVRKPKQDRAPVTVKIFGFINEFKHQPTETAQQFGARVKALILANWGTKQQQTQKLDALEKEFAQDTIKLQSEINQLFPAQSEADALKKLVSDKVLNSKHKSHSKRYADSYLYVPIFYGEGINEHEFGESGFIEDKMDLTSYGFEVSTTDVWDDDSSDNDSGSTDSSWFGGDSGTDSSSSGGSSCGSSCGGGCGS